MFKNFEGFTNLKYGISEKSDGAMELAGGDLTMASNRCAFFNRQGIDINDTASPTLSHTADVVKVRKYPPDYRVLKADGLVTEDRRLFLTVTVADCFPVYFYDPITGFIGLAHSGWRGTVGNIAGQAVKVLAVNPANLIAGIGPGIGACHFEIKKDILSKFADYPEAIINRDGKLYVDLPIIVKKQLIAAGMRSANIETSGECTFCENKKYFSFRRDKPKNVEAMIAYVGLI